jgi:hypothetical protein
LSHPLFISGDSPDTLCHRLGSSVLQRQQGSGHCCVRLRHITQAGQERIPGSSGRSTLIPKLSVTSSRSVAQGASASEFCPHCCTWSALCCAQLALKRSLLSPPEFKRTNVSLSSNTECALLCKCILGALFKLSHQWQFSGTLAAACQRPTLFGQGIENNFTQASMFYVQLLWYMQRHAAVVYQHHMLWRCWQGWQAFMHVGWHNRAQLNTAMRYEHNSLAWRAFSSWQQQWREYHCWLNLQQQRRFQHHLLR